MSCGDIHDGTYPLSNDEYKKLSDNAKKRTNEITALLHKDEYKDIKDKLGIAIEDVYSDVVNESYKKITVDLKDLSKDQLNNVLNRLKNSSLSPDKADFDAVHTYSKIAVDTHMMLTILERLTLQIVNGDIKKADDTDYTDREKSELLNEIKEKADASYHVIVDNIMEIALKDLPSDNPIRKILDDIKGLSSIIETHVANAQLPFYVNHIWNDFHEDIKNNVDLKNKVKGFSNLKKLFIERGLPEDSKQIKALDKQIRSVKSQFISKELVEDYLLNRASDSSQYEYLFHAAMLSSNPLVSSMAASVANLKREVYLEYSNNTRNKIQTFYDKWMDFHKQNLNTDPSLKNLYREMVEWKIIKKKKIVEVSKSVKTGEVDEDGNYEYKDIQEFELQEEIINIAEHRDEIDTSAYYEKKNLIIEKRFAKMMERRASPETVRDWSLKVKEATNKLQEFIKENFERQFSDEYYDIMTIPENVKEIYEIRMEEMRTLKNELMVGYSTLLDDEFKQAKREFLNLSSPIDLNGNEKAKEDIEIASILQEWREAKAVTRNENKEEDDTEAMRAYEIHRQKKIARLRSDDKSEEEISEIMRFFERENTTLTFTEDYKKLKREYQEKIQPLTEQINTLLNITPKDNSPLWEQKYNLTKSYKDNNFTTIGTDLPSQSVAKIKKIDEELTDLKIIASTSKNSKYKNLTASEKLEYKRLTSDRSTLYTELNNLRNYKTTQYYDVKLTELVSEMRNLFPKETTSDINKRVQKDDWYIKNHYLDNQFDTATKSMVSVLVPLSIWTYEEPVMQEHKKTKADYSYYTSNYADSIKDEYLNPNYVKNRFTNSASIKKGSKYDKYSKLYNSTIQEEVALARELDNPELEKELIEQRKRNIDLYQFDTNPELKALLKESLGMWGDLQNIDNYDNRKLGYSLPAKRKGFAEKVVDEKAGYFTNKPIVVLRKIKEQLRAAFAVTQDEIDENYQVDDRYEEIDRLIPTKDRVYNKIPIRYKSNLPFGEQSLNIHEHVSDFAYDDMVREKMEKEKFIYIGILETVKKERMTTGTSTTNILSKNNNVTAKHIEEFIKTQFYGESMNQINYGGVDVNKILGKVSMFTALTTLAHNYPGAVVNWMSATTQKMLMGAGGKHFNIKEAVEGGRLFHKHFSKKLFLESINFQEGNKSWAGNFSDYFGFFQGEGSEKIGKRYGRGTLTAAIESQLFSNYVRNLTEFEVQGGLAVTILKKQTVYFKNPKTGDYELTNLFDAYRILEILSVKGNEGLIKKVNTAGENLEIGEDWSLKNEFDIQNKIMGINIKMSGNYAKINKTVAEKTAVGTSLLFFRKYAFPFVHRRFGGLNRISIPGLEKYGYEGNKKGRYMLDNSAGEHNNGFYIEGVHALYNYLIPSLFNPKLNFKETYNALEEGQKDAVNQVGFDTALIIGLQILYLGLGGYDEDEYDEYSWFRLHALYLLKKLSSETDQFTVGGLPEINRMISTPFIPWAVTYNRLSSLLKDTFNTITGDDKAYYKRDTTGYFKKGDSRMVKDLFYISGIRFRTLYPQKLLEDFNYASRAR